MNWSCGRLRFRIFWLPLLFLLFVEQLDAQRREYIIGGGINVAAGGNNYPSGVSGGLLPASRSLDLFYGAYPSIGITSVSPRSILNAGYAFGLDWTDSDPNMTSKSHRVSAGFSRPLATDWNISLSESFLVTADLATFNAVRGVTMATGEFYYLFDPVAVRRSSRTNSAGVAMSYSPSTDSSVSFSFSHNIRKYGGGATVSGTLSDQQSLSGNINYTYRTAARDSWNLSYTGTHLSFKNYDSAVSHAFNGGYSIQIMPDLTMQLSIGAAHTENPGQQGSYIGYNTSARLEKIIQDNSFSLSYVQSSGQASGLGSVSDTRVVRFSVNSLVGRAVLFMDVSGSDARGTLGNPFGARGVSAAASIGFPLANRLSVHAGGQYQRYQQTLAFTQKRINVSLRYDHPALWRFFR